jgi:hypothetical protein
MDKFLKNHRIFKIILILALLIGLGFLGFKLYLYVQFLIGNDLVIQLETDNKDLSLVYGQSGNIEFNIRKVTSPFCQTLCSYSFVDVSDKVSIDESSFELGQATQIISENVVQNKNGGGQEIYRFSLVCKNLAGVLCHTSENAVSRDILVTVEYGPNEEQTNAQNTISQKIYQFFNETSLISSKISYLQSRINELNLTIESSNLTSVKEKLDGNFEEVNNLWKKRDYPAINNVLSVIADNKDKLQSEFNYLNETVYSKIKIYNSIVNSLSSYKEDLLVLLNTGMNESDAVTLEGIVDNFNIKVSLLSKSRDIEEKVNISSSIVQNNFSYTNGTFKANRTVEFNLTKIFLTFPNQSSQNFTLDKQESICCVYNNCRVCGKVEGAYPILFVHGHDFNQGISAEYSLSTFQNLQNKLDSDGFLNAGQLTLYDSDLNVSGILGLAGVPITVRSTYYYDVIKESRSIYLPVQVKSESIDVYSIKLKTLVDKLKYETGQDKVIIVTHSMGGLVARRYIQLFGNSSVDKLIMVSAPNNGVSGSIASLCSVFGASAECNDLSTGSLFLNKLNNDPSPYVNTYNIIGTGCQMDGGIGDGIVLDSTFASSKEYYINGSCSGIDLLHVSIVNSEELHQIIKSILMDNSV